MEIPLVLDDPRVLLIRPVGDKWAIFAYSPSLCMATRISKKSYPTYGIARMILVSDGFERLDCLS